jgi:hypothetical protein
LPSPGEPPERQTPPIVLRRQLVALRARGYTFAQAWPVARDRALRGLPAQSAAWWRCTFREQRRYWSINYSRAPYPAKRRPPLA